MNKILVLRLSALGDVAMTIPVIYSVARTYPNATLTVVTRPFFRRLFIDSPANIEFIDFDPKADGYIGLKGLHRFIKQLRTRDFTAVADLHDVIRTRIIRLALNRPKLPIATVNKDRRARKRLTDNKERTFQRNYVDRYFDVFAKLGFPANDCFTPLYAHPQPRAGIGIAPFARFNTKAYPPKMMERLCQILTDAGETVTLFGARGQEAETLEKWAQRNSKLRVVAGKLSLEEELRLMSRLRVMLTMDSANMHMASLVGTRVVSIWGSTIPQCGFLGYRQNPDDAIWLDLECQPCSVAGLPQCPIGHYACLERIAPEEIAKHLLSH